MGQALRPWQPELEVTLELAQGLARAQFEQVLGPACELVELGAGWDNRAFTVKDREGLDWVLRFPQRQLGAQLMELEIDFLGEVVELLGEARLKLPSPELQGHACDAYPWPFAGYRLIPGETSCRVELPPAHRRPGAGLLATLLARLHRLPVGGRLAELPERDPWAEPRRGERRERFAGRLGRLAAGPHLCSATEPWLARWDHLDQTAAADPKQGAGAVVHGDLYARHICVEEGGMPVGVIDWGDLHRGDPAVDLSLGWTYFEGQAREEFLGTYLAEGGIELSRGVVARAQQRALEYGALLLDYGVETGEAALEELGLTALELVGRSLG